MLVSLSNAGPKDLCQVISGRVAAESKRELFTPARRPTGKEAAKGSEQLVLAEIRCRVGICH